MDTGATISNFTCRDYPLEAGTPMTEFFITKIKGLTYSITSNNSLPKTPVGQERVLQGLALEPKTWNDEITFEIPGWTVPQDYTYAIAKSGVKSLRVLLIPNHNNYLEKTLTLRINYKDRNWNEIAVAEICDKIYRVKPDEILGALGSVTSQVSSIIESLAPFLGFAFPGLANGFTNFLIVKNQFR
jgi:hypothetical protein